MRNTRKLQFAAELIEEVSEDTESSDLSEELRYLANEVDNTRGDAFQEQLQNHINRKQTSHSPSTSDSHL